MTTPATSLEIIKLAKDISDPDVAAYVRAQGVQFARDCAPMWGICPGVSYMPGAQQPSPIGSPLWLGGPSDVPGALGYHDEDASGRQYIKVFQADGYAWPTTASHECLELKGDGPANIWAVGPDGKQMIAYELADPVEGDSYEIDGVPMSNFVLPAYFDPQAAAGSRLDFLGKLKEPLSMTPGGYLIVWALSGQPTEKFGAYMHEITPGLFAHFGHAVPEEKRNGIVAKYQKTNRRMPPLARVA